MKLAYRSAVDGPHGGQPVRLEGAPVESARAALVLAHGRGAAAEDILERGRAIAGSDVALVAPQAADHSWWPRRFIEPIEANEPWLSSARAIVAEAMAWLAAAGIASDRIALGGFSQGACLALEFAARHPHRYAALLGFAGGRVGPPGTRFDEPGDFAATPVLLAVADHDPHIPLSRVHETAEFFSAHGAAVDLRVTAGSSHAVGSQAIARARDLLGDSRLK